MWTLVKVERTKIKEHRILIVSITTMVQDRFLLDLMKYLQAFVGSGLPVPKFLIHNPIGKRTWIPRTIWTKSCTLMQNIMNSFEIVYGVPFVYICLKCILVFTCSLFPPPSIDFFCFFCLASAFGALA
jgi:hypothetical protein